MFSLFNFKDLASAFIVLFAIIDVTGSLPIFVDLQSKQKTFSPFKASLFSFLILLAFFFVGEGILRLFNVDISAFAVAGALVIFVIACEMTFGWELFKMDSPNGSATIVPVIFPLLAGPGAFTTLLSLKAEFSTPDIIAALLLNMVIVFLILQNVSIVAKITGSGGIYVLRKFFGIILLAISVKLFIEHITPLLAG
ncbi:MAG: MarC family protein [Dysgonamonadaceae bacterium]|jgi:multiple antibiotic resistance protein|nr:MarC family protein [Dysgonamonadaceae bacterium]